MGRNAFDLAPSGEVHADWPTIEGDPPTLDPAPKWDAVDLDAIPPEVFDDGELALPPDCPPSGRAVGAARHGIDRRRRLGVAVVDRAGLDGGSDITDYTIEHNVYPIEPDPDGWTLVDDGVGTDTLVRRDRPDER